MRANGPTRLISSWRRSSAWLDRLKRSFDNDAGHIDQTQEPATANNPRHLASGDCHRLRALHVQLNAYDATRPRCSEYAFRFARGRNDVLASCRKAHDQGFPDPARPARHYCQLWMLLLCISLFPNPFLLSPTRSLI